MILNNFYKMKTQISQTAQNEFLKKENFVHFVLAYLIKQHNQ